MKVILSPLILILITAWLCLKHVVPEGELHITVRAYKAETEDEISLEMGETIEVIHKLLDGWWVVRYRSRSFTRKSNDAFGLSDFNLQLFPALLRKDEETGHFPSMFLQKAGKGAKYEYNTKQPEGQKPPPRRSIIEMIHLML